MAALGAALPAQAAPPAQPALAALSGWERPGSGWQRAGLPHQSLPWTRFSVVSIDGQSVVQIDADKSYGLLVHPLQGEAAQRRHLSWRWRMVQPNVQADLRQKDLDDHAIKVCAMFDLPLSAVPFFERQLLRLARERSDEPLPAATVCYVWDHQLPAGTVLDSAYTRRVRSIVLQGKGAALHTWQSQRRDLGADFLQLFGQETRQVPPLLAIAVGADADNTKGRSQALLDELELWDEPASRGPQSAARTPGAADHVRVMNLQQAPSN